MKKSKQSYAELLAEKARIENELVAARGEALDDVILRIKSIIASSGFKKTEIMELLKKGERSNSKITSKAKYKMYRHPTDASLTWRKTGMTPRWLKDLVAKGHSIEEFEV